jgi:hypothetical protein
VTIFNIILPSMWANGSIVVKALGYKSEGCGFETLGPGVHSTSNRNEYRKHKNIMFLGKCGQCVGLTTLPSSISELCRQCGILNSLQPYRPPRLITGTALLFYFLFYPPIYASSFTAVSSIKLSGQKSEGIFLSLSH